MKILLLIALMAFIGIGNGVFVPPRHPHQKKIALECAKGPSYWCTNITVATDCNAFRHCLDTVWIHIKQLPPDNTSVCQTCLDMVKQARDQLLSNETQELIKEVFEGSCALLHLKPIVKECDRIADDYIPELIDTLASEMNPQVVCSVAGLCNNENVHRLLREAGKEVVATEPTPNMDSCKGCHTVVDIIENKFNKMSRDNVLHSLLKFCGYMGSFSDGCSNIMITYFNEIYSHLQQNLNANEICLMSGECSAQFHQHAKVEITPISHIGYIPVESQKDDLPCELCEQLVGHLRDLLIANTTEAEFKQVLTGICKQTGKFQDECLGLVNQYYAQVYNYLVNELNASHVCDLIGICHPTENEDLVIAPLLPSKSVDLAILLSQPKEKHDHVSLTKDTSVKVLPEVEPAQQLPIELLVPPHTQVLYNKEICEFCQYLLHYLQIAITEPKTEAKIKAVLDKVCSELPTSVNDTCVDFVNTYEPALVAILAQEIDPSQVCPLLHACPSLDNSAVEIFMQAKGDSKCPLCLFAVTKLESIVKDSKTKDSIKAALNKVCVHLSNDLSLECQDFIQTYTDELVEMFVADLKPEEVCVYLKLCTDEKPTRPLPPYIYRHIGGNIETNIIPDNTVNGIEIKPEFSYEETSVEDGEQCILCEFIMKEIEDQLKNKKNEENIVKIVHNICNIMPSSVKKECNDFVNQYADTIIQLLIQALEPKEICSVLKLCKQQLNDMKVEILECPICEMAVKAMEKILANPKVDHEVEHVLEKTCRGLPKQYRNKCTEIIDRYGDIMIDMLIHYTDKNYVCKKIGYCQASLHEIVID